LSQCSAVTRAGTSCRGVAVDGADYCYAHDPSRGEDRRRAASKGGRRGGRGRPRVEISSIKLQLQALADDVANGSVMRADAAVIARVLSVLLSALKLELDIKDQEEFSERLEALEEALAQRNGSAGSRGGPVMH
jgi:hypothetical protein